MLDLLIVERWLAYIWPISQAKRESGLSRSRELPPGDFREEG